MSSLIVPQLSMANSDHQKTTDVIVEKGQKAQMDGVIVAPEMYKYLRAEEERAMMLSVELIEERTKDPQPAKTRILVPLAIGMAIGMGAATLLYDKKNNTDVLANIGIGAIFGGLLVFSWQ